MVISGGSSVFVIEKLAQGSFLFTIAFQHQEHAFHRQVSRCRAKIELRARQAMRVALENSEFRFVDRQPDQQVWPSEDCRLLVT